LLTDMKSTTTTATTTVDGYEIVGQNFQQLSKFTNH